jgi:hypothetical protein
MLLLGTSLCVGLAWVAILFYTHTDPFASPPWQQQTVPAAASTP